MKAKSKQLKQTLRREEYKRRKELQKEKRQTLQIQLTKDYLATHSKIARKNSLYPLTEKIVTGNVEELKTLLLSENPEKALEVEPSDFPEGYVLPQNPYLFT